MKLSRQSKGKVKGQEYEGWRIAVAPSKPEIDALGWKEGTELDRILFPEGSDKPEGILLRKQKRKPKA